ncbi:hypothetical protein [Nonomuraea dietziae]|uniref:hypothetical protein n=1 Tax=Nonomuraea dietziae TaxID=65515 RepID=UPI0031D5F35A
MPDRAFEKVAVEVEHLGTAVLERARRVRERLGRVVLARAVVDQQPLAVGDRDGGRAEQLAQVPREARCAPSSLSPARSGGAAREAVWQGLERRALSAGPAPSSRLPRKTRHRHERGAPDKEDQQQNDDQGFHARSLPFLISDQE